MTFTPLVLTDAKIYYSGLDASGYSNHVEIGGTVDDEDTSTFGTSGYKARVGGLKDFAGTATMFWQAGDLTVPDDTLWANLGAGQPLTVAASAGLTPGDLAYLTKTLESKYSIGADVGKPLTSTAEWAGQQALARGVVLHQNGTARTSSGTGTGIQVGAVSAAQRMYANLHVISIAGTSTPTITVVIESSVDNTFASPTTRISFTAATAVGGQASSVVGAVTDQWWRAKWTISGSTPSFLFAVSAGIAAK